MHCINMNVYLHILYSNQQIHAKLKLLPCMTWNRKQLGNSIIPKLFQEPVTLKIQENIKRKY